MNDKSTEQIAGPSEWPPRDRAGTSSRRGVLKGLGVGSPVLLTLASAPVQAASVCIMPSGYISAATFNSRHQGAMVCTTQGPTFFKDSNVNNEAIWPIDIPSTKTSKFRDIFKSDPDNSGPGTKTDTLQQVLAGTYASDLTKYCIAAYMNSRIRPTGWPTDLTPEKAVDFWRYFIGLGVKPDWVPSAWTILEAKTWLSTLMPA